MTTKNKILMASLKFFLVQGYENTTLSMIADAVDIKKPSIYYHFKSKEGLLFNSIYFILDNLEEQITHSITLSDTPKDQLSSFFECILDFNSKLSLMIGNDFNEPINFITIFQLYSNRFSELSERINQYYAKISNILKDIIHKGQKENLIRDSLNEEMAVIDIISRIEGLIALSSIYKSIDLNSIRSQLYENLWASLSVESDRPKNRKFFNYSPISLGRKW
ncbi:TetR/AcrR family transcriptional regulator [Crassaminicella profunda]|uniref:TetR/AcrR family transcriptional regulator n=1 Tax=Crassaminicella profunda TaxID=1286698 RepID=UPI001CA603F1|nr:TetR/AcrR family transcriptional regulator [Crassaminicella profunda]QZY55668.1 TetR/AcrR family transcriptional regulator [Crassaminicella profunda]